MQLVFFVNSVSLSAYVANGTIMWQVSGDVASILILKKLKHFALIKNLITIRKSLKKEKNAIVNDRDPTLIHIFYRA